MSVCIGGCVSLKLERGPQEVEKRSWWGRGETRQWNAGDMQGEWGQLEEEGDKQEGAGLGVGEGNEVKDEQKQCMNGNCMMKPIICLLIKKTNENGK